MDFIETHNNICIDAQDASKHTLKPSPSQPSDLQLEILYYKNLASRLQKLADLENKIESGELIKAPCNIGTTVYWIDSLNNMHMIDVKGFSINIIDVDGKNYIVQLGDNVFTSIDEAEAKLVENNKAACKECFKDKVKNHSPIDNKVKCVWLGCEHHHFIDEFESEWRQEAILEMEQDGLATCKKCYPIRACRNDLDTCNICPYHYILENHTDEIRSSLIIDSTYLEVKPNE